MTSLFDGRFLCADKSFETRNHLVLKDGFLRRAKKHKDVLCDRFLDMLNQTMPKRGPPIVFFPFLRRKITRNGMKRRRGSKDEIKFGFCLFIVGVGQEPRKILAIGEESARADELFVVAEGTIFEESETSNELPAFGLVQLKEELEEGNADGSVGRGKEVDADLVENGGRNTLRSALWKGSNERACDLKELRNEGRKVMIGSHVLEDEQRE